MPTDLRLDKRTVLAYTNLISQNKNKPKMFSKSRLHRLVHNTFRFLLVARLVLFFSDVPLVLAADPAFQNPPDTHPEFSSSELLQLTNAARESIGEPDLTLNPELSAAAEAKALDMAAQGYWDHFRPSDHKAPWDFIEEAGYHYQVAGENLAKGFHSPLGVTKAWLASPTHAANLLSPKYREVGFASIEVARPNQEPLILTVQMFGAR